MDKRPSVFESPPPSIAELEGGGVAAATTSLTADEMLVPVLAAVT